MYLVCSFSTKVRSRRAKQRTESARQEKEMQKRAYAVDKKRGGSIESLFGLKFAGFYSSIHTDQNPGADSDHDKRINFYV